MHQINDGNGLINCDSILEGLKESKVFTVKKIDEAYRFREECDQYYQATLTKEQVLILIEELKALTQK